MKKIVLAGNSITASILYSYLSRDSRYIISGAVVDDEFVDSNPLREVSSIKLSAVVSGFPPEEYSIIMAAGYARLNTIRESLKTRLEGIGYRFETYVHPDARVYSQVPLGDGAVILPGAVIEPHAVVGGNTMVWCNVTLAHHCEIEENCWIASGAVISGKAKIRRNSFVGVNATVVNEVTVGAYSIIGGGAFITKSTKDRSVYLARSAEEFRFSADEYAKHFKM